MVVILMEIRGKNISLDEAIEYSEIDKYVYKRNKNNILLSDYQVDILNRWGINWNDYINARELLFRIEECLDELYDEELDMVGKQIYEFIYYNDTNK